MTDSVEILRAEFSTRPLTHADRLRIAHEIEMMRKALEHILKINPSAENAGHIMRGVAVNALGYLVQEEAQP